MLTDGRRAMQHEVMGGRSLLVQIWIHFVPTNSFSLKPVGLIHCTIQAQLRQMSSVNIRPCISNQLTSTPITIKQALLVIRTPHVSTR